MLDFTKSFYYFQIHTLRLSNELRSFFNQKHKKNKVKDKDGREEKWTKRIEGDNIIVDIWGKPDREKQ
jgi:hypothetical protein